jgi:hypothetical protein
MSGHGQVVALFALRWRMIRSRRVRIGLIVLAAMSLALVLLVIASSASVPLGDVSRGGFGARDLVSRAGPVDRTGEVAALLPSAMLAFGLFCIIAPLSAGGGTELIPEAELVAYPVRVPTLVRLSLVLTPLNIAWYLQVLVLTAATSYAVRGPGGPGLPLGVLVAFMAACTSLGQALGWSLVGVRRTRRGRRGTWILLGAALLVAAWVILTDRGVALLDSSPTQRVLGAQLRAANADYLGTAPVVLVLVTAAVLGYLASVRIASWALRRPGDLGIDGPLVRPVVRRSFPTSEAQALRRIDRASVWRSAPLRRGLLVLAVLPVAAAVVASLPWSSIALLPPLVASGAALLFGVNALSLDGSGALWIATLPHDPAIVLRSKARVVTEVVGGSVLLVLVGASLRASAAPTLQDLVCVLGASVSCTAVVVAICLRLSITRPHRADLRGPRDTPAPPGTMAIYSARLAGTTTFVGLLFSVSTLGTAPLVPVALTIGLLLWAMWSWTRTRRMWTLMSVRTHVVTTVAAG